MKAAYVRVHCVVARSRQSVADESPTERVYVAVIPEHWAQDPERVRRVGDIVGTYLVQRTVESLPDSAEGWDGTITHAAPIQWRLVPSGSPGDCENGGCMLRIREDGSCSEFVAQEP